jgi:6-pyruvoyltetrahydropterin/6-carboxytetrahydropterin synthase
MEVCVRIVEFDAGHRVMLHESKCKTVHGHRYKVELHARAEVLDRVGRVIDFSVLKEKIGGWIDEHWDHTFIVNKDDVETHKALLTLPRMKDPYVLPYNPTAENMAKFLVDEVCVKQLEGTNVEVFKVVVWETPNCFAEATRDYPIAIDDPRFYCDYESSGNPPASVLLGPSTSSQPIPAADYYAEGGRQ